MSAAATLLDWNRPAEELSALAPAMVWLGESMAATRNLHVGAARSTEAAGTLVWATPQSLAIATASHDIALKDFTTPDGRALNVAQMLRAAHLREGMVLPAFPAAAARAAAGAACDDREEARWLDDLRHLKPIGAPFHGAAAIGARTQTCLVLPGFESRLSPSVDAVDFAVAVVLAWLARFGAAEAFDIGLTVARSDLLPGAHQLLAHTRPFRVAADFSQPFERFLQGCRSRVAAWHERKPYPRDTVLRDARLVRPRGWSDFASWPVAVQLPGFRGGRYLAPAPSSLLTFAITAPAGEVILLHGGVPAPQVENAARQLATLVEDSLTRPGAALGNLAVLPQAEIMALRNEVWGARTG